MTAKKIGTMRANMKPDGRFDNYYLTERSFRAAYAWAQMYSQWADQRNSMTMLSGGSQDGMPRAQGITSNPTEVKAMRLAELDRKMKLIEDAAEEAAPGLYPWIMKAVTEEGVTYEYLDEVMDIPCSRNTFYKYRRRFYYILSEKIGV